MPWLLVVLLVCALPGSAQRRPVKKGPAASRPAPAAAVPFPVESITVQGNRNYSQEEVARIAGLKVGQAVVPKDFEDARGRLLAAGVFESIDFRFGPAPDAKGYAVNIGVVEVGPLFPVQFEDLGMPAEQLRAALKRADPLFGPKMPATEVVLNRYARVLEEYLASQNRKEKVVGSLAPSDTGQMVVMFRPAAAPPVVAQVKFTNNKVIPTTALQNTMTVVAVGVPYREPRFRQMLQANILPLYEARGRLRVSFPEIRAEKAPDVNGLVVTVKVDEGESYTVGNVRIEGPGIPPEQSKKAANIQTGDLANFEKIHAGVGRVETLYRHEGYMKVSSRVDRQINDQRKTVDLAIHIDPGPQYLFGKLTIEGLDLNAEAAVRKLWALEEGKRFNADYPNYFLEQVRQGGYFDNLGKTRAVLDTNDQTHTVNVKLLFSGAPPTPPDRFHRRMPGLG